MSKYLNPYTDFGFKKLFGEDNNKDLLQDFLNQLLPPQHQIAELNFQNTEQLPDISLERKAIFDIHCISTTGKRFIVEIRPFKVLTKYCIISKISKFHITGVQNVR